MKRIQIVWVLVVMFLSTALPAIPQNAKAASTDIPQPDALCLPGIYLHNPGDCLPVGPSTYLTQMAKMGITFPLTKLPASAPDPNLAYIDIHYGLVRTRNAPVYATLEDAMKGKKRDAERRIDSPFSYISYQQDEVVDGRRFYHIDSGGWMTANDVSRIGHPPLFQGLTFNRTPDHAFGWILTFLSNGPVESKRTPGDAKKDYTGHQFNNHDIVQVYDTQNVDGTDWYLVGPSEWLPHNVVARVIPNTNPPKGVTGDRWIEVNLYEQTISVYDHRQLVFASLIASGIDPFWTRPGLFKIFQKLDTTPMRGSFEADHSDAYYLENVPWTMYFDEARALHGAYWRTQLGFPQSHGCVNLSVGDAHWLYNWAHEGDWVYVWDPSGKTPTDPSLYTAGGA
ncbi:MAG: L,D-transpeptidase [Anaerolineales bacterium]